MSLFDALAPRRLTCLFCSLTGTSRHCQARWLSSLAGGVAATLGRYALRAEAAATEDRGMARDGAGARVVAVEWVPEDAGATRATH